ncbi:MAG: hypothetical protein A2189_05840 [Paenibacillus sp. RIFOXYA1_FULL_44_5]|nr:MAG: hypothetical protein A2189_05840 [Paenibacillus sp. RIFOXYA1_FULL_44_5]
MFQAENRRRSRVPSGYLQKGWYRDQNSLLIIGAGFLFSHFRIFAGLILNSIRWMQNAHFTKGSGYV